MLDNRDLQGPERFELDEQKRNDEDRQVYLDHLLEDTKKRREHELLARSVWVVDMTEV
jgi:hypothetical protein